MSRGVERATLWLPNKKHSFVRIISYADSGKCVIQFQNEKFESGAFEIKPEDLVKLFEQESFFEER